MVPASFAAANPADKPTTHRHRLGSRGKKIQPSRRRFFLWNQEENPPEEP
jgi:hypothetical protein